MLRVTRKEAMTCVPPEMNSRIVCRGKRKRSPPPEAEEEKSKTMDWISDF